MLRASFGQQCAFGEMPTEAARFVFLENHTRVVIAGGDGRTPNDCALFRTEAREPERSASR